jgi:hypothetical protein
MPLPHNIAKRGLSLEEAAEYCGVSKNTMTRHGPRPVKIGDRAVYDRRLLDDWLDRLTGLAAPNAETQDPEEQLLGAIRARKDPLRHHSG